MPAEIAMPGTYNKTGNVENAFSFRSLPGTDLDQVCGTLQVKRTLRFKTPDTRAIGGVFHREFELLDDGFP